MADQGLWFKLWCSILTDPDLANLELVDFARWVKLGALIRQQGNGGEIHLRPPAKALCAMFQVPDYETLISAVSHLPNVIISSVSKSVSSETNATVSLRNWAKYQTDYSTPRVRKFREMKRLRREEKRTKKNPPTPQGGSDDLSITRPELGSPKPPTARTETGPEPVAAILSRLGVSKPPTPEP